MIQTLIIVLAGLLPTYIIRFSLFGIPTNVFEAGVIAVFIVVIFNKKSRYLLFGAIRALPRSFTFFAGLFLVSAVVSTLYSPVLMSSLGILKGWVIIPMLFGLLVYTIRNNVVMLDLLRPAKLASEVGIGHPRRPGFRLTGRNDRCQKIIHSLILSGVIVALLGISQIDGFVRIHSIYDVPNSLALFLVPVFLIAFYVGIHQKNRLYQLFSFVMLAAIIGTQSFGAVVAIVGALVVVPLSQFWERVRVRAVLRGYYYVLFLLLCVVVFSFFTLSGRIQYFISPLLYPNTTNSVTVRLQLWDIGIRLIQKHPILGIGLGQFEPAYQAELHRLFAEQEKNLSANTADPPSAGGQPITYNLQPEFVFRDPHNWILSFWLNLGILGLISFTALTILALSFRPVATDVYSQAAALALISILIFGLFDTIYWKNDLSALWWMLIFLFI